MNFIIFKIFIIVSLVVISSLCYFLYLFFDLFQQKIKLNLLIIIIFTFEKENGQIINKKYVDYFTSIKDIFYLKEIIILNKISKRKKIQKSELKYIYGKIFKNFEKETEILFKIKKFQEIDYCITKFKIIKTKIYF